jgi:catechol 2,3-dioxygenase-like lactoylglutathione lyase family enzyme
MSRVQLALNVSDLEGAIEFYSRLFHAGPAKVRPGYANFAIVEPPLKLVLIESGSSRGKGISGALNHLGVEVESSEDVMRATSHLADEGLATEVQEQTTCCYALQDKVWVTDPDGAPWEVYTVLADAPVASGLAGDGRYCAIDPVEVSGSTETPAASPGGCC